MKREETELQVLDRIAREYRQIGMNVIVRPYGEDLPDFLRDFEPDAIAYGPDENLVIEVKTAPSLHMSKKLVTLAERINARPGWRLELVVQPLRGDPAQETFR